MEDPALDSHLRCGDVFGSSYTSDLKKKKKKKDTPVAALPDAWDWLA